MTILSPADFDNSGDVGLKDLLILLGNWGPCPKRWHQGISSDPPRPGERYIAFELGTPAPMRPAGASMPLSWGRIRPATVDSGQKHAKRTWVSGGAALHSCSESLAVEPGEGQMGNVGL